MPSRTITWSPAVISSWIMQVNQATAPGTRTAPRSVTTMSVFASRSGPAPENRAHSRSWESLRKLTPSSSEVRRLAHVRDDDWMQIDNIAGSSDTEVHELTNIPVGPGPRWAHTAAPPLGTNAKARL